MYTDSLVWIQTWPGSINRANSPPLGHLRHVGAPCSIDGRRRLTPVGRSLLQAQLRRVGLDEDGPEDLHVLAGARLHVLVQDVDPSLCNSRHKTLQPRLDRHARRRHDRSSPRNKIRDEGRNILFFCAECARIQSFLSGAMSDLSHPMRRDETPQPRSPSLVTGQLRAS